MRGILVGGPMSKLMAFQSLLHSQEKSSMKLPKSIKKREKKSMKLLFFSLLFSSSLWSRSIVLLGHFDAFGNAPFNSSERVAKHLFKKLKDHPDVDLRICSLETIFDKSFYQLED
jgi:hypothetical protein